MISEVDILNRRCPKDPKAPEGMCYHFPFLSWLLSSRRPLKARLRLSRLRPLGSGPLQFSVHHDIDTNTTSYYTSALNSIFVNPTSLGKPVSKYKFPIEPHHQSQIPQNQIRNKKERIFKLRSFSLPGPFLVHSNSFHLIPLKKGNMDLKLILDLVTTTHR